MPFTFEGEKQAGLPSPQPTKSFWHSEPSKFLLGHRTTTELPSTADVVIIGSGMSGVFTAQQIAEDIGTPSINVVMLEAREACWGATGRNGGHCQPFLFEQPLDVARFELKNRFGMAAFIKQNQVPCYWQERPSCHAYMSANVWEEALQEVRALEKSDPNIYKNVTVVEDKASLARMRVPNAVGAIVSSTAAQFWPYKLVAWVLEDLIKKGHLNLQTTTPALRLELLGHNKWAVHTPRGIIEANHVALTTNGYTSYLIPEFAALIVPVKGEMSALKPPRSLVSRSCDYTYEWIGSASDDQTHNRVQDDYLIQHPFKSETSTQGGQLLFGGAQNAASGAMIGVDDDSKIDEGAARRLRVALHEYMALDDDPPVSNGVNGIATNGLPEFEAEYEWSGIMGYSRDNFPWCGGIPGRTGLWIAAGYTGHGMPNTSYCGRHIAKLIIASHEGNDWEDLQRKLVEEGKFPARYVISEGRIEQARKKPAIADA